MDSLKSSFKKKQVLIVLLIAAILAAVALYQINKPLPDGISYEGPVRNVEDVDFLYDLTYKDKENKTKMDQQIFERVFSAVNEAEEFIVIDMFLFNGYTDDNIAYPKISSTLTDLLIKKKNENGQLKIVFITDEINTSYGSHQAKELEKLKENGIQVVITKLGALRDSNPLYSAVWRTFFQWFGQRGNGWLPNPLSKQAPDVTLRSYLKLLNVKANHRKVFVSEQTSIITSANAHDASGFNSNIAFAVQGGIIEDTLKSEQAVSNLSGGPKLPEYKQKVQEKGNIKVQLLTEGKIYKHLLSEIEKTQKGDTIWLGMFYIEDRKVLDRLKKAAGRGVNINLILDPNQNAFGNEKIGLPNLPVAAELQKLGSNNISIRWYNTGKEQYHTKLLFIEKEKKSVMIGGSANFTERNLDDLNLETNLKITASSEEEVMKETKEYFNRLWTNEDGKYTLEYSEYQDKLPVFKYIVYLLQKMLRFTTY